MPPQKKTIQDIKPSRKMTTARKRVTETKQKAILALEREGVISADSPVLHHERESLPYVRRVNGDTHSGHRRLWLLVIGVIIFFMFSISLLFRGATVTITPTQARLPDGVITLSATKDATTDLAFQTISVEGERSISTPAESEYDGDKRAMGIVTLYNKYSSSPQKLLVDTRLVGGNSLVYKTKGAVSIPGYKTVDGVVVPGQVDVEIYADMPGESSNIEFADFIIAGFVGTPKAAGFYGRTKTPISGGSTGKIYQVSKETGDMRRAEIQKDLERDLEIKLDAQIPEGYLRIAAPGGYTSLENPSVYQGVSSEVSITEKGQYKAAIVHTHDLAQAIASSMVQGYIKKTPVRIENIQSLIVEGQDQSFGSEESPTLSFTVKGSPHLVWILDENAIRHSLVEITKKQFKSALAGYVYIEEASVRISPFWQTRFPEKKEDIDIVYNLN